MKQIILLIFLLATSTLLFQSAVNEPFNDRLVSAMSLEEKEQILINQLDQGFNAINDSLIIEILKKYHCYSPSTNGLSYIKEMFLDRNGGSFNTIERFCEDLTTDAGKIIVDGQEDQNPSEESQAILNFRDMIIRSCYPSEKGLELYRKYAIIMGGKYENDLLSLVKLFPKLMPELFSCDNIRAPAIEGHFLLTIYDKKLFNLADFLLSDIEGEEVIEVKDFLSSHDYEKLRDILCKHISSGYARKDPRVRENLIRIFGSDSCN